MRCRPPREDGYTSSTADPSNVDDAGALRARPANRVESDLVVGRRVGQRWSLAVLVTNLARRRTFGGAQPVPVWEGQSNTGILG